MYGGHGLGHHGHANQRPVPPGAAPGWVPDAGAAGASVLLNSSWQSATELLHAHDCHMHRIAQTSFM